MEKQSGKPEQRKGTLIHAELPALYYANLALGVWLFMSAFVLPQTGGSRDNTWVTGLFICAISLGALCNPLLRWGNANLSGWLLVSTLFLSRPIATTTMWNNLLVAGLILVFSLIPSGGSTRQVLYRATPAARPRFDAGPANSREF